MDVWPTSWAKLCFIEANKLWFYSLVCSILGSTYQFFTNEHEVAAAEKGLKSTSQPGKEKGVKTRSQRANDIEKRTTASNPQWPRLMRNIITDSCDLFIPGAVVGWVVTGPVTVGIATVISTVFSSKDIWDKYAKKN